MVGITYLFLQKLKLASTYQNENIKWSNKNHFRFWIEPFWIFSPCLVISQKIKLQFETNSWLTNKRHILSQLDENELFCEYSMSRPLPVANVLQCGRHQSLFYWGTISRRTSWGCSRSSVSWRNWETWYWNYQCSEAKWQVDDKKQ